MVKIYQKILPSVKNAGFTLIELLVVVLIIGILSAIALPKYQMAVCKSHMVQVEVINRQIYDMSRAYVLANGDMAESFEDLGFSLPGYTERKGVDGADNLSNGKYSFRLDPGGGVPRIEGRYSGVCNVSLYTYASAHHYDGRPGHCIAYNDMGVRFCLTRFPGANCHAGRTVSQTICRVNQ